MFYGIGKRLELDLYGMPMPELGGKWQHLCGPQVTVRACTHALGVYLIAASHNYPRQVVPFLEYRIVHVGDLEDYGIPYPTRLVRQAELLDEKDRV